MLGYKKLATLSAKHELSLAVLDAESDVSQVDMVSGIEELRRRLEVLLGAKPEAPVDESQKQLVETPQASETEHRQRLAAAGGELLGATFNFLNQLVSQQNSATPPEPLVSELRDRLSGCAEEDESGRQQLTFTLPDRGALDQLAQTMARLMVVGQQDRD